MPAKKKKTKNDEDRSSIRIGPIDYEIYETPDLNDDGLFDMAEQRIYLQSRLAPQLKFQTLWHECIHGILFQAGYKDHSERQVDLIAYGVIALLRDNPELRECR